MSFRPETDPDEPILIETADDPEGYENSPERVLDLQRRLKYRLQTIVCKEHSSSEPSPAEFSHNQ